MHIKIVCVGRKSSNEIELLCREYEKRLKGSVNMGWQFVDSVAGKMTKQEQRQRETNSLLALLSPQDLIVLLDETGKQLTNSKLAHMYETWQQSTRPIVFVIGGAFGVSDDLRQRSDFVWSLSLLVFPHEMVRLILVEQLYRTQSIIDGLPYHHE